MSVEGDIIISQPKTRLLLPLPTHCPSLRQLQFKKTKAVKGNTLLQCCGIILFLFISFLRCAEVTNDWKTCGKCGESFCQRCQGLSAIKNSCSEGAGAHDFVSGIGII